MIIDRPSKNDMNALEKLGNKGWGWEDMLPYFMRVRLTLASRTSLISDHARAKDLFL